MAMNASVDYLTDPTRHLVEVFPPGDDLRDELDARGWTVQEFAEIIGRPAQMVSEILNAKKRITPQTAAELGAALGTGPGYWINAQALYDGWLTRQDTAGRERLREVAARGRLHERIVIRELERRGVVRPDMNAAEQEAVVCRLLGVRSLADPLPVAARRSDRGQAASARQLGWLACVLYRLSPSATGGFGAEEFQELAADLPRVGVEALRELPSLFAAVGVRLVYEPFTQGSKIDGAAFVDDGGPVIALSGRIPYLDSVLFTLLHECAHLILGHVERGEGYLIDDSDGGEGATSDEAAADRQASAWLLPSVSDPACGIVRPYTSAKITARAGELGVHPSVVAGRLKRFGLIPFTVHARMHVNVRPHLEAW